MLTRTLKENYSRLSPERVRLISACIFSLGVMVIFYAVVDYAIGYGQRRTTIFEGVRSQWGLEDWSHCMMVPFAALLIVWLDRAKLLSIPLSGVNSGFSLLLLGFFLYWFGYRADNVYFSYAAAQILLAGMILWFGGWDWMKALAFPWAFLTFMWPLLFLESFISFPLRMLVSHAGVAILNLIGIQSVLNGTGILSAADSTLQLAQGERFAVDVALPCSGMRSLFALMMVSALYGYFTLNGITRRGLLFLAALPLAVAGNICRIVMLTIGTLLMGSEKAIGSLDHPSFFHMLAGYVVFLVALGGMFGLAHLLSIWGNTREAAPPVQSRPSGMQNQGGDIY